MKKNNNKNSSARRKLAAAIAMLMISTLLLSSATYAWFTMNKEVKVTNMQVKAHAEEGLLINEVALATSPTWDDEAVAGQGETYIELRPASTKNLTDWWHANSKKTNSEAGSSGTSVDTANTVAIEDGVYYSDIKNGAEGMHVDTTAASAGVNAERNVYFKDATFGDTSTSGTIQPGEGFYVKYTYYLKSSNDSNLIVDANDFMAKVTATNMDVGNASGSTALDKSLRVGVMVDGNYMIYAPVSGADASYYVAGSTAGATYSQLDSTNTDSTRYTVSTGYVAVNSASITIPNVNTDGLQVDVYIWFEGEDSNCKSQNLTANLDKYQINVEFKDAALES